MEIGELPFVAQDEGKILFNTIPVLVMPFHMLGSGDLRTLKSVRKKIFSGTNSLRS